MKIIERIAQKSGWLVGISIGLGAIMLVWWIASVATGDIDLSPQAIAAWDWKAVAFYSAALLAAARIIAK